MTVTARFTCREEEDGSTIDQRTRSTAIGGEGLSTERAGSSREQEQEQEHNLTTVLIKAQLDALIQYTTIEYK